MLSLAVVTVLLLLYNKAFDALSAITTQRGSVAPVLFAAVFSGFAATFGLLAVCLNSTRYGLYGPNPTALTLTLTLTRSTLAGAVETVGPNPNPNQASTAPAASRCPHRRAGWSAGCSTSRSS